MTTTLARAKASRPGRLPDSAAGFRKWARLRRGWGVVLIGVAVVAGYAIHTADRNRTEVLMVLRSVPAGERVADADLGTASVAVDPKIHLVAGGERRWAVGKIAGVGLVPGSLLARSQLVVGIADSGRVLLPIALKAGQFLPASAPVMPC